jgi:hypothetical protein
MPVPPGMDMVQVLVLLGGRVPKSGGEPENGLID